MKRILTVCVATILLLSLVACNSTEDNTVQEIFDEEGREPRADEVIEVIENETTITSDTQKMGEINIAEEETTDDQEQEIINEKEAENTDDKESEMTTVQSQENYPETSESIDAEVQVDEGAFKVDITLGAYFFEDMTVEEIKEGARQEGYSGCVVNEDGSVTYTMTKAQHKELLDAYKKSMDESIAELLDGDKAVASFVDIKYNNDFSEINVYVDSSLYTFWDSFYVLSFYIMGAYYQNFAGVALEEVDVVVNYIDNVSGEILDTASYKEYVRNNRSEGNS